MAKANDEKLIIAGTKPKTLELTICGFFAALIAIGAYIRIEIPVEPYAMHFTMQWFAVLAAGFLLGRKKAAMSVSVYLIIGLIGVPVFASGGGPAYLIRPTFGFLLGFALAAYLIGLLMEKKEKPSFFRMLVASFAGLFAYYGVGILYFYFISNYVISMPVAWKVVLVNCCLLTIVPDAVLCVLAALVCRRLKPSFQKLMNDS